MPRRSLPLLTALLCLGACGYDFIPTEFLDGARKSGALATFLSMQQNDALTSGSVTLGEAGSLGRAGKLTIGARATLVNRGAPSTSGTTVSTAGEMAHSFATTNHSAVVISVDAAGTLWRGIRAGETHILGVTGLLSAGLLPALDASDLEISGGDGLVVSGGVRLGIVEETRNSPAIGFTTMFRSVPSMDVRTEPLPTTDGGTMSLTMNDITGSVTQWRAAASKHFGSIGLIAGVGGDDFEGRGDLVLQRESPESSTPGEYGFNFHRTLLFAGASYQVGHWQIGAEIGRLSGEKDAFDVQRFGAQGDGSKMFLSAGARYGP